MRPMNKRLLTALSALLAVTLLVAGCGSGKEDKNAKDSAETPAGQAEPLPTDSKKVVAEYEGGKVTEGELNLYLNIFRFFQPQMAALVNTPEAKREIVKQYIAEKLIVDRVKDDDKYEKKAEESLKQFEKQLKQAPAGGKDKKKKDMDTVLKENGITKSQLKTFLENNNKVSAYFENKVSEKSLKQAYEKSDDFYNIKLQHVLISTQKDPESNEPKHSEKEAKQLAEEVKKKLEGGEKFSKLAKKYSEDPGSKDKNGKVEGTPDQWAPAFGKAAKELPLKKISDPVKTEFGYHVIKVNERKKQPFDKVKDQLKGQKVQEMYQDFIKEEVKIKKLNIPGDKGKEKK
ncbi:peptidyl-prolyl cis-trans isomerase C/foldase protein PrsA [Melghirimyces profundicolus]|uniref:Peptidyl-prolyl cis-trans isomerase C/foldase protein PrsA n=1 Tax=Melghirimyces profundicolus TaxID=1242148 RepID=A0A2T6BGQ2_9BACL|nr:peptidylprolyl isomerase [Melghirimyces profundicolus]PTX55242.1 peptidyl-prolyl cis-trans isomerase C/foldase protein PrsA [Melghirimyces profundicolus]